MTTWGELKSDATVTTGGASTWDDITEKPETFPPSTHTHAAGDVTGTAVLTNDARLADARTPTTHSHATTDITGTAVVTTDARLSDARTPTSHDNTKHSTAYLADAASDGSTYGRKNGAWEAISGSGLTQPQVLARGLGA